jgi:hypothetical protein
MHPLGMLKLVPERRATKGILRCLYMSHGPLKHCNAVDPSKDHTDTDPFASTLQAGTGGAGNQSNQVGCTAMCDRLYSQTSSLGATTKAEPLHTSCSTGRQDPNRSLLIAVQRRTA